MIRQPCKKLIRVAFARPKSADTWERLSLKIGGDYLVAMTIYSIAKHCREIE